jgi:hypothetical protein
MKKAGICIFLFIMPALISSCQSKSNQDILTGGNYKYWIITSNKKYKYVEYFDKNGKDIHYELFANG